MAREYQQLRARLRDVEMDQALHHLSTPSNRHSSSTVLHQHCLYALLNVLATPTQALERGKPPDPDSRRTSRSCADTCRSVSTVGAMASSVYAQSGYADTTHRTAHSNTTFRPRSPGRARTQPLIREPASAAERETLAAQLRVMQAHVATSHEQAVTVAALSEELALTNMKYDASNLFGFGARPRLPAYVRGAAAARSNCEARKDHRHTIYAKMAKRSAIAEAKERTHTCIRSYTHAPPHMCTCMTPRSAPPRPAVNTRLSPRAQPDTHACSPTHARTATRRMM